MVAARDAVTPESARNLDAVRRGFAGIAAGSVDAMLESYTDDLVLELPYASPPKVVSGKEAIAEYLGAAFTVLRFVLEITDVHELVDPTMLVLEYTSEGRVLSTGRAFANRYIGIYWFRDGQVRRVREFYNPMLTADALRPELL